MDGDNGSWYALWEIVIGANLYRHVCKWEELEYDVFSMLYYVVGTVIQFSFACHQYVACRSYLSGSNTSNHPRIE